MTVYPSRAAVATALALWAAGCVAEPTGGAEHAASSSGLCPLPVPPAPDAAPAASPDAVGRWSVDVRGAITHACRAWRERVDDEQTVLRAGGVTHAYPATRRVASAPTRHDDTGGGTGGDFDDDIADDIADATGGDLDDETGDERCHAALTIGYGQDDKEDEWVPYAVGPARVRLCGARLGHADWPSLQGVALTLERVTVGGAGAGEVDLLPSPRALPVAAPRTLGETRRCDPSLPAVAVDGAELTLRVRLDVGALDTDRFVELWLESLELDLDVEVPALR